MEIRLSCLLKAFKKKMVALDIIILQIHEN